MRALFLLLLSFLGSVQSKAQGEPMLTSFYLVTNQSAPARWRAEHQLCESDRANLKPVFRAYIATRWPSGLVPVFQVEKPDRTELRRLPPKGQEGFTEPLFFALPLETEPNSALIAGHWELSATKLERRSVFTGWELSAFTNVVSGRFDQTTDYRFASITSGIFSSNQLELKVEYIEDKFILHGLLEGGKLSGTWRKTNGDPEEGIWSAGRAADVPLYKTAANPVLLFEWEEKGQFIHAPETPLTPAGWKKLQPLARIWLKTGSP